jgi:signal peptidase II
MKKHIIIIIAVILSLVAIDQITKILIVNQLEIGEDIVVIENFFTITSHRNDGAAWGILGGNMIFFYLITIVAIGLFYYLLKDINFETQKLYAAGIVLMISGGIGNFIDRILFQQVVDFIDIDLFSYTTFPIFNIADICLVVGMIIFVLDVILEEVFKWKQS